MKEITASLRATDRVGNVGNTISETVRVDTSMPELVGWTVDPLTTNLIGTANISFSTYDLLSGIDEDAVSLQYGFDNNGVGLTPDLSGQWLELPGSGLDRGLAMAIGQPNLVSISYFERPLLTKQETVKPQTLKDSK